MELHGTFLRRARVKSQESQAFSVWANLKRSCLHRFWANLKLIALPYVYLLCQILRHLKIGGHMGPIRKVSLFVFSCMSLLIKA